MSIWTKPRHILRQKLVKILEETFIQVLISFKCCETCTNLVNFGYFDAPMLKLKGRDLQPKVHSAEGQ